MKWNRKPEPRVGDTKEVTRFCWLPKLCSDNLTVVWLGRVRVTYMYYPAGWGTFAGWEALQVRPYGELESWLSG